MSSQKPLSLPGCIKSTQVEAAMYFLVKNELYLTEKPYAFRFPNEDTIHANIPQTNMRMMRQESIQINNIRGNDKSFSFKENGFEVLHHNSSLRYEEFYDPEKVPVYLRELEIVLKTHFKANFVEVFRYGLRKRDPTFPVSTGESYNYDQPTSVAHVDTTPEEAKEEVKRQHGENATPFLNKRFQWVNIWKPLKGPVNDWPLAVCDASVVDEGIDLEAADLLYPDLATENYQVYYKPKYEWYYLADQVDTEIIVFKQSDSISGVCPGVPHCSFLNPLTSPDEAPRESIEARALVYYDN